MLNGRNWWTKPDVKFDYTEDINQRIEREAKSVWEDFSSGPNEYGRFVEAVKKLISVAIDQKSEKKVLL